MNPLFGTKHVILILATFALIVALYLPSRKMQLKTVCKTLFVIGICSEIIKLFYYIIRNEDTHNGVLPKTDLPFHLCSIQIIFITIVTITTSEKLKRFIFSFMLPSCLFGGIAAILIATDSSRNGSWIITLQYFVYHAAISAFALHLFTSKEIKFNAGDYVNCLKFLLVIMFFAIYINSIVDDGSGKINFMYVVGPPQNGLPYLNKNHGWLVYIIHYAFLVLACVTGCYAKPLLTWCKERKAEKCVPAILQAELATTSETENKQE